MTIRFDNQVALITGGGRGMGREHCLLIAERGATVVVNDLGVAMDGSKLDEDPAAAVAAEIIANGGRAIANHDDVGTVEGPAAMVAAAIEQFGRIDIIVHNAAIVTFAPFGELTYDQYKALINVHVDGGFLLAKAAWPHMASSGYGRFVFITSQAALSGLRNLAHYVIAKTAVTGLARAIALEGEELGIRANALGVTAFTRMMQGFFNKDEEQSAGRPEVDHMRSSLEKWWRKHMRPGQISPVVAWLASSECDVNGLILDTAGGFTLHQYLATTQGFFDPELTPESVHLHREKIFNRKEVLVFNNSSELSAWRNEIIAKSLLEK